MASTAELKLRLIRDYYREFSRYARGRAPKRKIAWVSAFTPVEILEALGMGYVYPESYAAQMAASGLEQELLAESERRSLCRDCCSYACCFEGSLSLERAPRGMPPSPDVLISTNNQCNTLPTWWNVLAERHHVPLITLDYPGEAAGEAEALPYVSAQHEDLIGRLEALCGHAIDRAALDAAIENSRRSVEAWREVEGLMATKQVPVTEIFDGIAYLITARPKPETAELYRAVAAELRELPDADADEVPVFWLGYPLWYHPDRHLSELMDGARIAGSNYATWWSIDYSGRDAMERLFHAYNYTFLNLSPATKQARLAADIARSGARGAVVLHNKSCKCDFVSARSIDVPQAELEIDMIDREFADVGHARSQFETFMDALCGA